MTLRRPAVQAAPVGDNSSAVRRTASSAAPPEASVAAITAPSTTGASQTRNLFRRTGSSRSIAISLLVSAPPRSTRITTPASDQARSIAVTIAATSVPRPPSGLPPVHASGTLSPTICRTMSAAPSATLGECDTITTPTLATFIPPCFSFPLRRNPSLCAIVHCHADRGDHQRRRARTRIHVPDRTLAQERRAALGGFHRHRGVGRGRRALPQAVAQPCAARRELLVHGGEHVQHRF